MNKKLLAAMLMALPVGLAAQNAFEAFNLSQSGLRGTARYMSMGGAFTALGGDVSCLHQNPAGIGIYRSSDLAATLQIDFQSAKTAIGDETTQTRAACNNVAYVGTYSFGESSVMPYLNWGASYARTASFDRHYAGRLGQIGTSLTNFVADYTSEGGWRPKDLLMSNSADPYWDSSAPWMSIMMYNGYGINPQNDQSSIYQGLYDYGRSNAQGWFDIREKGYVDDYTINLGGNVMNMVYWGLGFGITDIEYRQDAYYSESIGDARVAALDRSGNSANGYMKGGADMDLDNYTHTYGTGFNFKFGMILKPVNEFRIGLAIHTPTYYDLTTESQSRFSYDYSSPQYPSNTRLQGSINAPGNYPDVFDWKLRTPWRLMAGMAGVIGSKGILSIDYEYRPAQDISMQDNNGNDYYDLNNDVKNYFKAQNIVRLGAEYRATENFSLRAGYVYESSPVTDQAEDNSAYYYTSGPGDAGTQPSVTLPKSTQYVTAGLGFHYQNFYADLAYVHKYRKNTYHAFTSYQEMVPDENGLTGSVDAPLMDFTQNDNSMVLTLGFRF